MENFRVSLKKPTEDISERQGEKEHQSMKLWAQGRVTAWQGFLEKFIPNSQYQAGHLLVALLPGHKKRATALRSLLKGRRAAQALVPRAGPGAWAAGLWCRWERFPEEPCVLLGEPQVTHRHLYSP